MSIFAMILTAAMLTGDTPKKEAEETKKMPECRGEWTGLWWDGSNNQWLARIHNSQLSGMSPNDPCADVPKTGPVRWKDEGEGKCIFYRGQEPHNGIYRLEGENLQICFNSVDRSKRPISFKGGDGQHLLTLHRVKPQK
jgi:hypothetical protein